MAKKSKSNYGGLGTEVGVQFSSIYQPNKTVWTKPIADKFMGDLVKWLQKGGKNNILFNEFIHLVANPEDYHPKAIIYVQLPNYLAHKYTSCLYLLEKAKKIQEVKLQKYGLAKVSDVNMAKFILVNDHGLIGENVVVDNLSSDGSSTPKNRLVFKKFDNSKHNDK